MKIIDAALPWHSAESTLASDPNSLEGSITLRENGTDEYRVTIDGDMDYVSKAVSILTGEPDFMLDA